MRFPVRMITRKVRVAQDNFWSITGTTLDSFQDLTSYLGMNIYIYNNFHVLVAGPIRILSHIGGNAYQLSEPSNYFYSLAYFIIDVKVPILIDDKYCQERTRKSMPRIQA
jgi:hypothetical protein